MPKCPRCGEDDPNVVLAVFSGRLPSDAWDETPEEQLGWWCRDCDLEWEEGDGAD